ncbi:MAG: type II toxin-antitoxin system HicA family toxin [Bacteroidota bacterium]
MNKRKLFERVRRSQTNVRFDDFVRLVESFGFRFVRQTGSHKIYEHPQIPEMLNIQERDG